MKLLSIEFFKTHELAKQQLRNVIATGTRLDGGPDTDGEENCFPTQNGPKEKDCEELITG